MTSVSRKTKPNERRGKQRYAMKLPLLYRAAGAVADSEWKRARGLDMSASGILVGFPEAMPVGTALELAMDWPGLYHDKPVMRLFLKVRVVRTDSRGAALRIVGHEFRDASRPSRMMAVA